VHYQDYPVGNRAAGLGGAFAAIANDPSGLFYNPAGIVDVTRNNLSVSTSLYGLESTSPVGLASIDIAHLALNIIPSEVGSTNIIGKPKLGESARAVWGLDVMVPSSRNASFQQQQQQGDSLRSNSETFRDQTLWAGLGAAYRWDDRWSFGLSAFVRHREISLNRRTTGSAQSGEYLDETASLNAFDDSLLAILGAHYQLDTNWSFGLSFQTPSIDVRSGGQASGSRVQWAAGGASPTHEEFAASTDKDDRAMKLETRTNGLFRLGAAYGLDRLLTVTVDITVAMPVTYNRVQFRDASLQSWFPLPLHITRETTVNGSLGVEWLFTEHMSLAGGFFTNRSSSPTVKMSETGEVVGGRDALPHVDLYGGSLAWGWFGEHSLTRVGIAGSTGLGQDVTYDATRQIWISQPLRETFAYVFVSSTFRY
jgi:long-chain fatty acid transport protein